MAVGRGRCAELHALQQKNGSPTGPQVRGAKRMSQQRQVTAGGSEGSECGAKGTLLPENSAVTLRPRRQRRAGVENNQPCRPPNNGTVWRAWEDTGTPACPSGTAEEIMREFAVHSAPPEPRPHDRPHVQITALKMVRWIRNALKRGQPQWKSVRQWDKNNVMMRAAAATTEDAGYTRTSSVRKRGTTACNSTNGSSSANNGRAAKSAGQKAQGQRQPRAFA